VGNCPFANVKPPLKIGEEGIEKGTRRGRRVRIMREEEKFLQPSPQTLPAPLPCGFMSSHGLSSEQSSMLIHQRILIPENRMFLWEAIA
jgi:hypothetical protein